MVFEYIEVYYNRIRDVMRKGNQVSAKYPLTSLASFMSAADNLQHNSDALPVH
jgi:hypothetical protein